MRLALAAAEQGISIAGLASGYSMIDKPDSPPFMWTCEILSSAITRTSWLGGDYLLISFEKPAADVPDRLARSWVAELAGRMVPAAGENRVLLAYELVWPALYETPADLLEVLDAVDSPQLGIYFDPANVLRRNVERRQQRDSLATPEQWLGELRDHLKSVHMKDYSEEKGYVDLLAGEVNWKAIRELLDQTGYQGWLIGEIEVEPKDHLLAVGKTSKAISRFMRGQL